MECKTVLVVRNTVYIAIHNIQYNFNIKNFYYNLRKNKFTTYLIRTKVLKAFPF